MHRCLKMWVRDAHDLEGSSLSVVHRRDLDGVSRDALSH